MRRLLYAHLGLPPSHLRLASLSFSTYRKVTTNPEPHTLVAACLDRAADMKSHLYNCIARGALPDGGALETNHHSPLCFPPPARPGSHHRLASNPRPSHSCLSAVAAASVGCLSVAGAAVARLQFSLTNADFHMRTACGPLRW